MFSFRTFFALFLIVPVIEIYLLIQVGGLIGAWPTIFLIILTAILGGWLLRNQGLATMERVQQTLARGEIPAIELLEGAMLLVGGALLLTPGFFTDTIGFICLIPILRRNVILWAMRKGIIGTTPTGAAGPARGTHGERVINGECWHDDDRRS